MKNVKLCFLMMFAAAICGLAALPAAAVSTSNHPDGSEPMAPLHSSPMSDSSGCVVSCPLDANMEQESCGEDKNGGCNMPVPAFEPITIGETICGTAWANAGTRDTDWYQVTITVPTKLIFTVRAEFQVLIFLMYPSDSNQPISCSNHSLDDFNSAPACTDVQVSRDCQPGTYWLWVGQYLYGYPCGSGQNNYVATLKTPYCEARGNVCDEYISNVQVGDINNSSGCSNYADYTALSTEMIVGGAYPITVTNGRPVYSVDQCGIWVDWNHDGDFDDPCEAITVSGTPGVGPYTATIVPPLDAAFGGSRMRIRITYTGAVSPCDDADWGEVEDYTITVEPNADLNRDGIVDFKDFAFFANQWLTTRP